MKKDCHSRVIGGGSAAIRWPGEHLRPTRRARRLESGTCRRASGQGRSACTARCRRGSTTGWRRLRRGVGFDPARRAVSYRSDRAYRHLLLDFGSALAAGLDSALVAGLDSDLDSAFGAAASVLVAAGLASPLPEAPSEPPFSALAALLYESER